MAPKPYLILLISVSTALCACNGSGGSGVDASLTDFDRLEAATNQLRDDFTPVQYSDLATIPTSGSANYQGYLLGQLSNTTDAVTDRLAGQLTLTVDFAGTEMVSGNASNFVDDQGQQIEGQLELSGGTLDRDGDPNVDSTFVFRGSGDLVDADGQTLIMNTDFEGDFLDTSHSGLGGDVIGQVAVDGEVQSFGGLFIASQ